MTDASDSGTTSAGSSPERIRAALEAAPHDYSLDRDGNDAVHSKACRRCVGLAVLARVTAERDDADAERKDAEDREGAFISALRFIVACPNGIGDHRPSFVAARVLARYEALDSGREA